jgi:hypothetical protein
MTHKEHLAEPAARPYEETARTSLSWIDWSRSDLRTAVALHGRIMRAIADASTNPAITTGQRAPATTPTLSDTRADGLLPPRTSSAAVKTPIVAISHPHIYTVSHIGVPLLCAVGNLSSQSRLTLILTRLTSTNPPAGDPRRDCPINGGSDPGIG